MKRRWKVLWWTIGGLVALFIVLGTIGAIFFEDEEGPEPEAPTATATPTTTAIPTPTPPAPTLTAAPQTAAPTPAATVAPTPRPTVARPKPPPPPPRPAYCRHYDAWASATATADGLERRHGDDTSRWPARDLDAWFDAMDDRGEAANRLWDAAPSNYRWSDVRKACD